MKRPWLKGLGILSISFSLLGCGLVSHLPDDPSSNETVEDTPVIEPTERFYLALGGVAPGRDTLVIYDDTDTPVSFLGHSLSFRADPEIVGFQAREGFETFVAGSGAQLVPLSAGTATVYYSVDNQEQAQIYSVVIPPQSLIQILMGEARSILTREAIVENGAVTLESRSATGEGVTSVIQNRISLITANNLPGLFGADPVDYALDPPGSWYDAVINAPGQFQPAEEGDSSHDAFEDAERREELDADSRAAYDQAVLTAGAVFAGEAVDPTNGAFAFRSPNEDEWERVAEALRSQTIRMPEDIGTGDLIFPALSPVQVLIDPEVWTDEDGRPAFIFTRSRSTGEPAVTNVP